MSTERTRPLLNPTQLMQLEEALCFAYAQHRDLCASHPIALGQISRPSLPPAFSESLAAIALFGLLPNVSCVRYGGRAADLLAQTADGDLSIEVKASGASRFQELKPRDLSADALVWIDFGVRYVHDGHGPIVIHLLPTPSRYEPPRNKLTLDLFLAGVSELEGFTSLPFASIDELLRSPMRAGQRNR